MDFSQLIEKYEGIEREAGSTMATIENGVHRRVFSEGRYLLAREIVRDLKKLLGEDPELQKTIELERMKKIIDKKTPNPNDDIEMPYYSIMTIEDFFGPPDDDEAKYTGGPYDRRNIVYFRFNFSKLKAIYEIWSPDGKKLHHSELWNGTTDFNLEYFDGMVCDGAVWVVRSSETGEEVASFIYNRIDGYKAYYNGEVHDLDDEVEMMDFVLEKLGGIRVSACMDCWDGCEKCGFSNSIIEKVELDEDAV